MADQIYQDMLNEFSIAKDLKHPNIVEYYHFSHNKKENNSEFDIIIEYLEGGNLKEYIQSNPCDLPIDKIKSIGK